MIERLREARAAIIDPAITAERGRIIKTMGDGLLLEFASPGDAVRAALAVQRAMAQRAAAGLHAEPLRLRIGINHGEVVIDGDDVLGDVVNIAARLESLAPAGGVCVSRAVQEQVAGIADVSLTPKEYELLVELASDPGAVLTREHLIDSVWDEHWWGSTKTLDVHMASLRKKLAPELIETVRGVGFRLVELDGGG